ncbi:sigma-70 family RNA polymerase sigma factor [bacterium]|nr:sigma-70 family RNA polymerase sigma factor [bacterium]MDB4353165.1 sigma-70 family RNA polymerase sigma factor [bacterium]
MTDTQAIQQYLQLRSEFMGYLYAITRDAELAEEVYQNAAVVVIEKASSDETIREFRSWAKEVVRRQALHAIRARETAQRHGRAIAPELLEAISETFCEDESTVSLVHNEATAMQKCVDDLPQEKQKLIAMRYEHDATFDEISSKMNSTPAAIQRALSRIRKMLHECTQRRLALSEGQQ